MQFLFALFFLFSSQISPGSELKQTPEAYFTKAFYLLINNKPNEAITYFKLLHSRFSTYPLGASGLLGAAVLYDLKGDFPAAHKSYGDFLTEYPSSFFSQAVKKRFIELESGLQTANPIILRKFTKIYVNSNPSTIVEQYSSFIKTFPKLSWNINLKLELAKYYIFSKRPAKAEKILISALSQSLKLPNKYMLNEVSDVTFKILVIRGNYTQLENFATKLEQINNSKFQKFKSAAITIKNLKLTGIYSIFTIIFILTGLLALKYRKETVFPLISSITLIFISYVLRKIFIAPALFSFAEIVLFTTVFFKIKNHIFRYTILLFALIIVPFHLLIVSGYFPWILFV